MANFVAVPGEAIETFLQLKFFERSVQRNEVVYTKRSTRNPAVCIKVYTSIHDGQTQVRAAGKDAIRVCTIFDNGSRSFGIGKFPPVMRVHSVESVMERLGDRITSAARRGLQWMEQQEARFEQERGEKVPEKAPEKAPKVDFSQAPSYLAFLDAVG